MTGRYKRKRVMVMTSTMVTMWKVMGMGMLKMLKALEIPSLR